MSYGSVISPSLKKMENSRGYGSRRKGIQMGNILGDPFALATISISMLAWVIAFISFIVSAVQEVSDEERVNKFGWWSGVYALFLNIIVFVVVASDTIHTYHVAISSYCAVGLVLSSIAIQNLIYWPIGSRQASAAGFVLLAIIQTIWIFYFGSTPSSTPRAFLDSFALAKESTTLHRQTMNPYGGTGRPETSNSVQPPQMYTSAQLNGFENPSPVGGTTQANGARNSTLETYGSTLQPHKSAASPGADTEEVVPPTEYPYRAKAIYSYEANPADANEISFTKHEVLEVSDVSGRWWQARKSNGDTGIAPSNYLILL